MRYLNVTQRTLWSDALYLDCKHKRTDGCGLLHATWCGECVGCLAASGVGMSDTYVKGLQGAWVVWPILGGWRQRYYSWQYVIFENNDWHLRWKGFELWSSLPFREPWWQWLDVAIMIVRGVYFKSPLRLWQLKCESKKEKKPSTIIVMQFL